MGGVGRPIKRTDATAVKKRERYANDTEYREGRKKVARDWARDRRLKFDAWKNTLSCTACGEGRGYTLDFHHVDGKEDNGGSLIQWFSRKGSNYTDEFAACVVLCSNCHRESHYLLKTNPEAYAAQMSPLPHVTGVPD